MSAPADIGVPGDKSIGHRALLLGSIARGPTMIHGFSGGADNQATLASGSGSDDFGTTSAGSPTGRLTICATSSASRS